MLHPLEKAVPTDDCRLSDGLLRSEKILRGEDSESI